MRGSRAHVGRGSALLGLGRRGGSGVPDHRMSFHRPRVQEQRKDLAADAQGRRSAAARAGGLRLQ